jgi:hypothetical protein
MRSIGLLTLAVADVAVQSSLSLGHAALDTTLRILFRRPRLGSSKQPFLVINNEVCS